VSITGGAVLAMAVLAVAGGLPATVLAGVRWVAVPLAPLTGAVLAALSAAGCLASGGTVLGWFAGLAVVANVLALAAGLLGSSPWARRPRGSRHPGQSGYAQPAPIPPRRSLDRAGHRRLFDAAAAGAVVAMAAVCLTALRAPSVGFDARTIWMLHGVWYAAGHQVALAALRNPSLSFAHASYPPLVGATVAVSWGITGDHSYRLGVVMVALLNGCAVTAAALVAVEAGRSARGRLVGQPAAGPSGPPGQLGPSGLAGRHGPAVTVVGATVVGVLLVGAAFGVAGPFATNGYADLLWAAAAVGAVGFGLVLSGRGHDLGAAAVLLAVAGATKDEGTATAALLVVAITVRALLRRRSDGAAHRRLALTAAGGVLGVAALLAWPVLVHGLGAAPNVDTLGVRSTSDLSRAGASVRAAAPHLHVLVLAAAVAGLGAVLLARTRRRLALGNDGWAWLALLGGLLVVGGAYAAGGGDIQLWLITSVHRTTFFPDLVAWWVVGMWAVVGVARLCGVDDRRSGDAAPGPDRSAGAGRLGLLGQSEDPLAHDVPLDLG
jgi:hypothetical protein